MNKTFNNIFLIGYMGAGKTVIGKSLSKKLIISFMILDNFIELKKRKKFLIYLIKKMKFILEKLRINTLISYLQKKKKIISTGGGTPCFENNLDIILNTTNSTTIYLKANVNTLVKRLKDSKTKRPLISHLKDDDDLKDFIS